MQAALIQAPTGYADGNGNWQQPRDQAQHFFPRKALEIQTLMATKGKAVEIELITTESVSALPVTTKMAC